MMKSFTIQENSMTETIFSIGHSNKKIEQFIEKMLLHKIDVLVDIRSFPRSRFCPWFNEKRLAETLKDANVTYLFKGNNLGGMAQNTGYEDGIVELSTLVKSGKKVCVMCSEADHTKCHRTETIEPSLKECDVEMVHIQYT